MVSVAEGKKKANQDKDRGKTVFFTHQVNTQIKQSFIFNIKQINKQ